MANFFETQPWYVNVGIGAAGAFALSMLMARRAPVSTAKPKGDAIAQYAYQMGVGEGGFMENDQLDTSTFPDDTYTGDSQGAYSPDELEYGVGDGMYDVLIPAY